MSALVIAAGLSVGHHGCEVLTGVDLELHPGEVVAILGPNGAGKSTLLRTLAGLLPPISGEVTLGDEPLAKLGVREVARRVALVPQEETVEFRFTAREIVAMGRIARANGLFESEEDHTVIDRALVTTDAGPFAARPFTALSGGERQRVLIARALAQETPALFLDEPTAHLDVRHQVEAAQLIRRLAREEGRGILIAVHDLNFAGAVADRALLVADRRVVTTASMDDLVQGDALDRAYGVSFRRVPGLNGGQDLLPPLR